MVNKKQIKAKMVLMGLKNRDVANAWGCAEQTAYQKLSGIRPLSLDEANALAKLLNLSEIEYYSFLFKPEIA